MDHDHLQIPIDSDDASWRQRCSEMMEELKNVQFPSQDAASQPELLHKELVVEKEVMIYELYKAVENGNVDNFVDVLKRQCIERKLPLSDIFDKVTGAGDSLLHVAADKGREQIAELICDHFPELLIRRNVRGDTPLHVAVRSKNSTIVKVILSQYAIEKSKHEDKEITSEKNEHGGHVVHYLNKSKRSPLFLAVESGNVEILNLLLQIPFPADQPLPQCFGNSPLHAAILERKPALIREILKEKPELVYLRDEVGGTPLHYAAYIGYVEEFRTLLEKSDHTSFVRNKKGHFPIHLACKMGHVKVVKDFLQREWPINPYVLLNQKGQNILHVAAKNGRSNVVEFLLRNQEIDQFSINQKDNDGNTPLHLASINLFPQVLFVIKRDKRIDMKVTNNDNLTARDIVHLALKTQVTFRKFIANKLLKVAGAPVTVNGMLHSQRQQPPKMDSNLKDVINTSLVVATLMVTVTFAAAFTVPGGVYSSDDPNPQNRGRAVFVHSKNFYSFTFWNTLSMYSSVVACGLLLMARIFDKLAFPATLGAMLFLAVSFAIVPFAFMYAVYLVVVNNSGLVRFISIIGYMYYFLIGLGALSLATGTCFLLSGHAGPGALWIFTALIDCDIKPKDSYSHRANKDKNKNKDEDKNKDD